MSSFGDAVKAIRDVLLLQSQVHQLTDSVKELGGDLKALASDVAGLAQRMARIEGFIEGAASATRQSGSPRIEG